MRISTSYYAVRAVLGEKLDVVWGQFTAERPQEAKRGAPRACWHWVLQEVSGKMVSKTWRATQRVDQRTYLRQGIEKGWLTLRLSIKADVGRVWQSDAMESLCAPPEVLKAIKQKQERGTRSNDWAGPSIEIYMPMHQKHPGLAEHAVLGMLEAKNGVLLALVSDQAEPDSAPLWQVYELNPGQRMALPKFLTLDRGQQRDFEAADCNAEVGLRGLNGVKLSDEHVKERLSGVKKFAWRMQATAGVCSIPSNARKFKLGEEITEQERKAIPLPSLG